MFLFLDDLADLHVAEWGHLYSGWGVEAVRSEFLGQRADGSLPATLVLHEGMDLVGSVSVFSATVRRGRIWILGLRVCMSFQIGGGVDTAWS